MDIKRVHQHVDDNREADLELFKKLVAQPSVAAQNLGIKECCEMLCDILRDIGIEPQVFPTSGSPVVFGELSCGIPNAKTIMFYGHYDVQPPEPIEAWNTPPFEPTIIGNRLYGRGTGDNKGQLLAHLFAVRSYLQTGTQLPVNIKFFLEGEEENGSVNILDFIEPHKDLLKADLVYNADGGMHDSGAPLIYHGVRGMLQVQFDLQTATTDNHSGNKGGQIPNAAWELIKFMNTMIAENGKCSVEGFYDDVIPPSDYDLELIDKLEFNPESIAKIYGVEKITLDKRDFYLNLMFQPTFNINGLASGYTGAGSRTIIPGSAVAKMDMRLADNQDPYDIFDKIVAHTNKYGSNIKVTLKSAVPPSSTKTDLPVCKAVAKAIQTAYQREPIIMPRVGATNPEYVFTKILQLPSVCVPYANADENNHAPNENMDLDCFYNGIHASVEVIKEIGALK